MLYKTKASSKTHTYNISDKKLMTTKGMMDCWSNINVYKRRKDFCAYCFIAYSRTNFAELND